MDTKPIRVETLCSFSPADICDWFNTQFWFYQKGLYSVDEIASISSIAFAALQISLNSVKKERTTDDQ